MPVLGNGMGDELHETSKRESFPAEVINDDGIDVRFHACRDFVKACNGSIDLARQVLDLYEDIKSS